MRPHLAPPAGGEVRPGAVPTFSVIVAAYQAEASIAEAVDSALAQTRPPLEVIVCDDGSTDGTVARLAPYRDRIELLRQENRGEGAAKNAAGRAASGEFVVILDADDAFLPERLEALGQLAAERPDLDIITTDAFLEVDGRPVQRAYTATHRFASSDQRSAILRDNFVFGLAAVRRRRLLEAGGFDESIRYATDWDLWIRMILDGSLVGLVAEPLARYRVHTGSLSWRRAAMLAGRVRTLTKAASHPGLSQDERRVCGRSLADHRARLALAEAREALVQRRADARRRALAVALGRGQGLPTRLKASIAVAAPRLAAGRLVRRPQEITAGLTVPPSGAAAAAPTSRAAAPRSSPSTGRRGGRHGP